MRTVKTIVQRIFARGLGQTDHVLFQDPETKTDLTKNTDIRNGGCGLKPGDEIKLMKGAKSIKILGLACLGCRAREIPIGREGSCAIVNRK